MLTLLFAVVIGAVLGMLGGGGSILTVPVLTYVAGLDPKIAIASSLPVVAVTSAFGALGHWRAGQVQLRVALIFGAFTMVGGFAGARVALFLSGEAQLLMFAGVMLAASVSMLRPYHAPIRPPDAKPFVLPLAKLAPLGLGVGMLTGVVGVGGGFLIVPALVQLGHVPIRRAIGTSLLVIAMNAAAGTIGYAGRVDLPVSLLLPFTGLALAGIAIGTFAAQRVEQSELRRLFAFLLLIVGAFILYQNRVVLEKLTRSLAEPMLEPTASVKRFTIDHREV